MTDTDIIDRIYECSVAPELWPQVLLDVAHLTDSQGGLLFSAHRTLFWTASGNIRDVFADYVTDGWFAKCSRRVCLMGQTQPSFFGELDFWSEEQLAQDPIYRDFFRPRGLGWSAGTALRIPTGDNIVFSIERAFEQGPVEQKHVERLNALRPHLARSALVSSRLGLQRAKGATETLTALRLPAILVDDAGRVVETNDLVEGLGDAVRISAAGKLSLADPRANDMLTAAVAAIEVSPDAAPSTFPVRDAVGQPVAVLHVMPIKRTAHDIFAQSYALLMLTPVTSDRAPSIDLMRSLFDLTVSEARVARGVAMGQTLEEIAAEGDVAITTVRSQLRRVLEKTGCSRQAEVAALLAGVTIAPN